MQEFRTDSVLKRILEDLYPNGNLSRINVKTVVDS